MIALSQAEIQPTKYIKKHHDLKGESTKEEDEISTVNPSLD